MKLLTIKNGRNDQVSGVGWRAKICRDPLALSNLAVLRIIAPTSIIFAYRNSLLRSNSFSKRSFYVGKMVNITEKIKE